MKITKTQLRRLLREMDECPMTDAAPPAAPTEAMVPPVEEEVPQEDDYDKVRTLLDSAPEMVDQALNMVMNAAGATCPISTRQAIIDHLQDDLAPSEPDMDNLQLPTDVSLGIPVGAVLENSRRKALLKRRLRESVRNSYSRIRKSSKVKISETQLRSLVKKGYQRLLEQQADQQDWVREELLDLATREQGVSLDEINETWGQMGFDIVDEMTEEGLVWLDDQEAVVYAAGTTPSPGLEPAVQRYTGGH